MCLSVTLTMCSASTLAWCKPNPNPNHNPTSTELSHPAVPRCWVGWCTVHCAGGGAVSRPCPAEASSRAGSGAAKEALAMPCRVGADATHPTVICPCTATSHLVFNRGDVGTCIEKVSTTSRGLGRNRYSSVVTVARDLLVFSPSLPRQSLPWQSLSGSRDCAHHPSTCLRPGTLTRAQDPIGTSTRLSPASSKCYIGLVAAWFGTWHQTWRQGETQVRVRVRVRVSVRVRASELCQ